MFSQQTKSLAYLQVADNVRNNLLKVVPAGAVCDISCFVFYDNHPRDLKKLDVTICSKYGEVKEFYQRHLVSSVVVESSDNFTEMIILRNKKCKMFYLLVSSDELVILSRKDKLAVHKRVPNVDSFEIIDPECSGQPYLKIICKDDAVPLVLDDNFEEFQEQVTIPKKMESDDSAPILTHLKRKLVEAAYSLKCNENAYGEITSLRQLTVFSIYQKLNNSVDPTSKVGLKDIAKALKIDTKNPWIRLCNKKIVIVLNICNRNSVPINEVAILLTSHDPRNKSTSYSSKIYKRTNDAPYWNEIECKILKPMEEAAVVAVIDVNEVKLTVTDKISYDVVICYKPDAKYNLLPFEPVTISGLDMMGSNFDVLSSNNEDIHETILAILATSEKTDLCIRHITKHDENITLLDLFCDKLKMETLVNTNNIVVHRQSPYHILYGIMLVLHKTSEEINSKFRFTFSVYARSPSQILGLIHLIHDTIQHRLIITTVDCKIKPVVEELSKYNEETVETGSMKQNYSEYGTSMIKQSKMVLQYFDECRKKMGESRNPSIQEIVSSKIDMYAAGKEKFIEFRNKMIAEFSSGTEVFISKNDFIPKVVTNSFEILDMDNDCVVLDSD